MRATPTPFAINATCPRYFAVRSEIEHCEPLPLRLPLARSRPHPRPSAIRLEIKRFCQKQTKPLGFATWARGKGLFSGQGEGAMGSLFSRARGGSEATDGDTDLISEVKAATRVASTPGTALQAHESWTPSGLDGSPPPPFQL
eukprot:CAMPEP_0181171242 /NCGR_PEP_ID=MMETSP1096-20121128/1799_1 /TAXON_ID=156174 ORGANISM="Chrysochromulina ericina, Strain CCMP281" /NCGR_SAMPLE_ID=MMETSP1096 /ASSEMBLY_ACC=CAM_ASM_000453 /LENGTH=142 /DNA_ID=CAMNT_0023258865 /DNA_START=677 /DNA_END=1105 /DNA_ORIENTATION=+